MWRLSFDVEWAEQLTEMGKGKHFIGDFLPPDELEKFMETFKALKVRYLFLCRSISESMRICASLTHSDHIQKVIYICSDIPPRQSVI